MSGQEPPPVMSGWALTPENAFQCLVNMQSQIVLLQQQVATLNQQVDMLSRDRHQPPSIFRAPSQPPSSTGLFGSPAAAPAVPFGQPAAGVPLVYAMGSRV
jgi:hypothetical protein